MSFMCQKHKSKLAENPESATAAWSTLINTARRNTANTQWQSAIVHYGNALDVAEIIFSNARASLEVNRYIRTAVEFIYTVRRCRPDYDCDLLIQPVKEVLQKQLYPASIELLLKPLEDVSFQDLPQVDRWMKALFVEDEQYSKAVH